ncbi:MAG: hypothetical protein ACREI2_08955 [Nitrospiraceae bacterium]
MAGKSFLVALANLRRLESKVFVTENLLTRAFVYLLDNDRAVFKFYLNKLGVPYSPGLSVRDQDTFGENTPDMQISGRNPDVFVL